MVEATPKEGQLSLICNVSPQGLGRLHRPAACLVTACLQGIMKAAASELGSLKHISTVLHDSATPAAAPASIASLKEGSIADVHGSLGSRGLLSSPHLLPSEQCSSAGMAQAGIGGQNGELVISGGLGALGLLVSAWLAQQLQGSTSLHLLGRTGRPASAHAGSAIHAAAQVKSPICKC